MNKVKIVLNGHCGIGGNRKKWPNDEIQVVAVELNPEIAAIYQDLFPNDTVIVGDVHEYLLKHYKEFDFIWLSPPCPTHSDIRRCGVHKGQYDAVYPNMELYEEIILLMHFGTCPWVVENVRSYYKPLIKPYEAHRHYFWSNFVIDDKRINDPRRHNDIIGNQTLYGFDLSKYKFKDKRQLLRNCVDPDVGLSIYNLAFKEKQSSLLDQVNTK